MSQASTIVARIKTILEAVTGFSADRVVRGIPSSLGEGASPPVAWVYVDGAIVSTLQDAHLTGISSVVNMLIVAIPNVSGSDHATREDACMDLADSFTAAIQTDTTLLGYLSSSPTAASSITLDSASLGPAVVGMVVECPYLLDLGAGN